MTDLVRRESELLLYTAPDGAVKVGVLFRDETAWLTQKALAELFAVKVPAINKHLKNIFESGELSEDSVVSILETTAADGKAYKTRFYNLDAIIAVGYRVNSYQATQFRIWATKTLREFMIKGFVLDDERLEQLRAGEVRALRWADFDLGAGSSSCARKPGAGPRTRWSPQQRTERGGVSPASSRCSGGRRRGPACPASGSTTSGTSW
jgi:integrase